MAHVHHHHDHECCSHEHHHHHEHHHDGMKQQITTIAVAALLLVVAVFVEHHYSLPVWQLLLVYLVPYLIVGFGTLKEAAAGIAEGEPFNEHFLM